MSRGKRRSKAVATRSPGQPRDVSGSLQRHRENHDGRVTKASAGGYPSTVGENPRPPAQRRSSATELGAMGAAVSAYEPTSFSSATSWHPSGSDY